MNSDLLDDIGDKSVSVARNIDSIRKTGENMASCMQASHNEHPDIRFRPHVHERLHTSRIDSVHICDT